MGDQPYQLLPPLSGEEYAALKADIAENGIRVPVDVDEAGTILDGHHRVAIAAELGIDYPTRVVSGLDAAGKAEHALTVNVARRQLTQAQRRDLIRAELDRDPDRSDRAIARLVGVDHKTVGAVRRGESPHEDRPRITTREEAERVTHRLRQGLAEMADSLLYIGTHGDAAFKLKTIGDIGDRHHEQSRAKSFGPEVDQATRWLFRDQPTDMVMRPEAYDWAFIRTVMLTGCYPGCPDPCPYVGGSDAA